MRALGRKQLGRHTLIFEEKKNKIKKHHSIYITCQISSSVGGGIFQTPYTMFRVSCLLFCSMSTRLIFLFLSENTMFIS